MSLDPAALLAELTSDDFIANAQAAQALAVDAQQPPTDIIVTVYDQWYRPKGDGSNYIKLKVTWPRLKLPTGQLILKGTDSLADHVIDCDTTVVPVAVEVGALRWGGRIDVANDKMDADGNQTIECTLVGDLTFLDRICVWPEPFLPIEVQPSDAIYFGPAITVFKTMVAENCMRLQLGINELFDQLGSLNLDWRSWFGNLLTQDNLSINDLMQMVSTPICVVPTNPFIDTSPWIGIHGRMDTCWNLMVQQLKDNGIYPSMDLWLPGDPQPEGLLSVLQVPTLVFNLRDYEGRTGPTGTAADGLIEDFVDLEHSMLGKVLEPFLNPQNEYVPPGSNISIAPTLGVNYAPPWAIFNADLDGSGLVTCNVAHHHPVCWQLVLGGRSPKWMNDLINAFFEYVIDMIMIGIGITGIDDSMLDGILDNVFMAFEVYELFETRVALGPFGFPERFFPTQSTYSVDTMFAAMAAAWDVKGYPAAQISFYNGLPYTLGRDLFPGAQAIVIKRGTVYADYIDELTLTDTADKRALVEANVGDGRREDAPMTMVQRKISGIESDIMLMLLAPPDSN